MHGEARPAKTDATAPNGRTLAHQRTPALYQGIPARACSPLAKAQPPCAARGTFGQAAGSNGTAEPAFSTWRAGSTLLFTRGSLPIRTFQPPSGNFAVRHQEKTLEAAESETASLGSRFFLVLETDSSHACSCCPHPRTPSPPFSFTAAIIREVCVVDGASRCQESVAANAPVTTHPARQHHFIYPGASPHHRRSLRQ